MRKTIACLLAFAAGWLLLALTGCSKPAAVAGPVPDRKVADELRATLAAGLPEAAGDAAGGSEASGTGWGTLSGTFKFAGDLPATRKLNVDKETEICGKGQGIADNSLLIASDKGISNVVLYARVKRVHESAQPIEADSGPEVLFDQKGCMFLTHVLAFQLGDKVTITNSDPIGHNTKIEPAKGVGFNQSLPNGQKVLYPATAEEALPATVSCSIHPWMRAYMLPRKDKYFAVTKADGSFEIPNLPAGEELEIQVWHERAATPNGGLALDRKDLKWTPKGRFKIKLEPDKNTTLALDVPASAFK